MDREQKRAFRFVNYVLTSDQSDALLRVRRRLARGFDPLSISVLLEWFYLSVVNLPKDQRLKLERDLSIYASEFQYPSRISRQRTGARLDEVVVDWIASTTEQTVNTSLSAVLSFLAKSEKKILSNNIFGEGKKPR